MLSRNVCGAFALVLTSLLLSDCGGGGGGASPAVPVAQASAGALADVTWNMSWATTSTSSTVRKPAYLAPTARSASIKIISSGQATIDGAMQYLNAPSTTSTFKAPIGNDTFEIKTYDEQNGQGNVLSIADITQQITAATKDDTLPTTTMNGVIASLLPVVSYINGPFTLGVANTARLTVTAFDADGNAILEPVGTSDFNTPIHITLVKTHTTDTGNFTLSQNLLQTTASGSPFVTLSYDGGNITSAIAATITTSATGATNGVATVAMSGVLLPTPSPLPTSSPFATPTPYVSPTPGPLNVSTFAGTGFPGSANGIAQAAQFNNPMGIAVDTLGNVYVADTGNASVRKILANGSNTFTLASGLPLSSPTGIAVDIINNVYVTDGNQIIEVNSAGTVSPVTMNSTAGYTDGPATTAQFNGPRGIAVVGTTLYVADTQNNAIRTIINGNVSTFAGGSGSGFSDGSNAQAKFNAPSGVAISATGIMYVADTGNNAIRQVSAAGTSTIASGAAIGAPIGIGITSTGTIMWADSTHNVIWSVTPPALPVIYAGSLNSQTNFDGPALVADFVNVFGLAVDPNNGNKVYVSETAPSGDRIRLIH